MKSADTPITVSQLEALLAEMAAMRAELAELRSERAAVLGAGPTWPQSSAEAERVPASDTSGGASSRRRFMRTAASAAAGVIGAAVVLDAHPAAAASGPVVMGVPNEAGTGTTGLSSSVPANSVLAVANSAKGSGACYSASGANAYTGQATDTGVTIDAGNAGGVFRGGAIGVDAASTGVAGTGVRAAGQVYGVDASGQRAALHISNSGGSPMLRSDAHAAGEIYHEDVSGVSGRVWICVKAGTPGVWREIASAESAGQLHPVSPHRVYDSRPGEGILVGGQNRIVSVKDGRNLLGAIELTDLVPVGATAISYNLTIINTIGSGFLAVTPAGDATYAASAINWTSSGAALANASIVNIDSARNITVWAGGGGGTHFIIDIVGYYR